MKSTKGEKKSFEVLYQQIEESVKKIEEDSLSISDGMKLYEETMKKIKQAQAMPESMEKKIEEISPKP